MKLEMEADESCLARCHYLNSYREVTHFKFIFVVSNTQFQIKVKQGFKEAFICIIVKSICYKYFFFYNLYMQSYSNI